MPEIRFPGFTGDWEQCKLGDIAKMYQPPTISGSELLDTGYPVLEQMVTLGSIQNQIT